MRTHYRRGDAKRFICGRKPKPTSEFVQREDITLEQMISYFDYCMPCFDIEQDAEMQEMREANEKREAEIKKQIEAGILEYA